MIDLDENQKRFLLSRRSWIQLVGATACTGLVPELFAAEPLAVIVNPGIKETPSSADLAAIFTTRKQSWGGGKRIVPFNFPAKHPARVKFDETVLSMGPDEVARDWIDRRIRGGNPPPKQVPDGRLIARLVEKLDGAIGYVPESAVSGNVRVVKKL